MPNEPHSHCPIKRTNLFAFKNGEPPWPDRRRHGHGKTVTLQTLTENFSARGVPVFMADVKGDLGWPQSAGRGNNPKVLERAKELKIDDFKGEAYPVVFWDVFGEQGHPVRATVSEISPLLLARLLELNDTQEGVLNMVFKIADENGLLLLDLKATSMVKSAMRAASSSIGRQIARGILGGILGGSGQRR
jgi:DNA helicase HerA-like ATPase